MLAIEHLFGSDIDYYLDEPLGGFDTPSQILDLSSGEIIRGA